MSTDLRALVDEAANLQIAGNLDGASRLCNQALELDPACVPAKFILSTTYARMGKFVEATELLSEVILAEPHSFEALMSQSSLYSKLGRLEEAADLAQKALKVRSRDPRAEFQLGRCLLALRRLPEAESCFRRLISQDPRFAPAHHSLGSTLQLRGSYAQAANSFEQAARLSPSLSYELDLGETLLTLGETNKAEACAHACLTQDPNSVRAHLLMCGTLAELGRNAQAETHLKTAMKLDRDAREALKLAQLQRQFGLMAEARANYQRAIANDPETVWPYKALIYSQKIREEDRPLVETLERILQTKVLSPTEYVATQYGLGKALEDLGDYESSMRHYDEANRVTRELKLSHAPFNRDQYEHSITTLINTYTPKSHVGALASNQVGPSLVEPILIVGMMRSGTTLAEHILSSHPAVAAAGELAFWTRNSPRALAEGPKSYQAIANEYLELLRSHAPTASHVTDKMPGNYRFAGLIHQALPQAKFIHMRRSPVDTCISIWATTNELPNEGGHDKGDLVFVYKQYLRLMEHWRAVLPPSHLIEIDYEDLVLNREAITRKMVEFCGLTWSDQCLSPEENSRLVRTPSHNQVRQPVYATSIGRGLKFKPWLGDFDDLL